MAERGFHPRSGNSTDGWNVTGTVSFLNQPLLDMAGEIKTPVLLIHGEKAHSRYFSEGAFARLKGTKRSSALFPVPSTPIFMTMWPASSLTTKWSPFSRRA